MQEAIVAIIVAVAAWAVLRRYTPQPLRRACRAGVARIARKLGWRSVEDKLAARAEPDASCADGCGACNGCGPSAIPKNSFTISLDELKQSQRR